NNCRIDPPLRSQADRKALVAAVADGTIDAICSQHKPLGNSSELAPFPAAKPGIAGIQTLLPLVKTLVDEGQLSLSRAIDAVTQAPARCLGITARHLAAGRPANMCVLSPDTVRTARRSWCSAGKNSPWLNTPLAGSVELTLTDGR